MKSFTPEKLLVVLLLTALPFSGHSVTPSGTENLFVSNLLTGTIWQFGLGGELISSSYGVALDGPQGLAFDHSGNLYVAYGGNTGRVAKFGPGGNLIDASFASGFTIPGGMAFDSCDDGQVRFQRESAQRELRHRPVHPLVDCL